MLGFAKGFRLKEVSALTLPVSKPMGLLWLTATTLFLLYGSLYVTHSLYTWLVGFAAVVISQILVILCWKDAKFGTIPNSVIAIVSIASLGSYHFHNLVQQETNHILHQTKIPKEKYMSETTIKNLPEPVKKWLRTSRAIGKPFISVGKVLQKAEMKMKPGQDNWMPASAIQYTTIDKPAFIWIADVKINELLSFRGRDKFENGKGEMLIKINSLINVVNEQGEKINEGAIQRYLGEMVWFPSLAVSPYITWEQLNDTTAKATMLYKGTKGSGTFYFNSDGNFTKFSALRYKDHKPGAKRYEWVLLVNGYKTFEGSKIPAKMTATWKLEEGDWTWLKLEITSITYNKNAR